MLHITNHTLKYPPYATPLQQIEISLTTHTDACRITNPFRRIHPAFRTFEAVIHCKHKTYYG